MNQGPDAERQKGKVKKKKKKKKKITWVCKMDINNK